jgi:serine/threonine protein kinase
MSQLFVIDRRLAEGGQADLFLGRMIATGEQVVIKFLREKHLVHARRFFAREVRILGRGFRGFVRILHADVDGARPHYVMQYLPGGSLAKHAGKLNERQLLVIIQQFVDALGELHGAGIAHGDIKPDNTLVDGEGLLRVADPLGNGFGCTLRVGDNHGGTQGYWAPEVASGGVISTAGDMYSVGATVWHLATGRVPYDGELFERDLAVTEMSVILKEVISACVVRDPSARATISDVNRILKGERWVDIRAAHDAVRGITTFVALAGGAVLLIWALSALAGPKIVAR